MELGSKCLFLASLITCYTALSEFLLTAHQHGAVNVLLIY